MALVLVGWSFATLLLSAQVPWPAPSQPAPAATATPVAAPAPVTTTATVSTTTTAPSAATSAPAVAPTPWVAPAPVVAPAPAVTEPPPPPDTQPVVRAAPGNWGMTFIFGGLAPLSFGGLGDQQIGQSLMFTEIGVRRVFKKVVIPFSFGAGISRDQPVGQTNKTTSAGVSASVAVLKGFRVWRRIAPYYGAFLHFHYIHPPGAGNWLVNVSVGPILGVEYFLADRVSLYGQGIFGIGPDITRNTVSVRASSAIAAGGQLGLTFYF
jgi:hypothetical protein